MSKMSDMAMTIEELRNAAAAINDAADWLSRQFSDEPAVAEPELKLEDVRSVLADMSRSGVDPANYSALLKDVEELDHAE